MILALAATGPETRLWLLPAGATTAETLLTQETWESGRDLAAGLLTHINDLLTSRGASWNDLTGIVVLSGPGSFTTLRIIHTVANTLASSLGLTIASAKGDDWLAAALKILPTRTPGAPVWPVYGGEANITRPRT